MERFLVFNVLNLRPKPNNEEEFASHYIFRAIVAVARRVKKTRHNFAKFT